MRTVCDGNTALQTSCFQKKGRVFRKTAAFPGMLDPHPGKPRVSWNVGPASREVEPAARKTAAFPGLLTSAPVKFTETRVPGVILIEPRVHGDDRGFFMETYRADIFKAN